MLKSMLKGLIATAVLGFGLNAMAKSFSADGTSVGIQALQTISTLKKTSQGIVWRVGESAKYSLFSSFGKGRLIVKVVSETDDAYWVHENIYFQGKKRFIKRRIKALFSKDTGAMLRYIVNGEEQRTSLEDRFDQHIDIQEDCSVTVPAGTFDCHYREGINGNGYERKMWLNPQEVSVFGFIEHIYGTPYGDVTVELVSFKW